MAIAAKVYGQIKKIIFSNVMIDIIEWYKTGRFN